MTMTHSDKVIQQLSGTWPYGLECWGHDPMSKESVELVYLALQARRTLVALCQRQCTKSSGKWNQQACAVTNSSEFKKY